MASCEETTRECTVPSFSTTYPFLCQKDLANKNKNKGIHVMTEVKHSPASRLKFLRL